jgi:co-chaperonin GroES (HSP10)
VPRNKAIIFRRSSSEQTNNNGILKPSKGKNARKNPRVLAIAPAFPETGANKDLTIHLKKRSTFIPPKSNVELSIII